MSETHEKHADILYDFSRKVMLILDMETITDKEKIDTIENKREELEERLKRAEMREEREHNPRDLIHYLEREMRKRNKKTKR